VASKTETNPPVPGFDDAAYDREVAEMKEKGIDPHGVITEAEGEWNMSQVIHATPESIDLYPGPLGPQYAANITLARDIP